MEKLMEMLREAGYDAELVTVNKADGEKTGLSVVEKGECLGRVYYDVDESDFDEIVRSMKSDAPFTEDELIDKFKDLTNLILCIRPKSGAKNNIITRDFLDLELYVRCDLGNGGTSIITKEILNMLDIDEETLFVIAEENSRKNCHIMNLAEVVGMPNDGPAQYVVSANDIYGASAMKFVGELFNEDVYILPSSVHEVICVPCNDIIEGDTSWLNDMVQSINTLVVDEEDVLANHIYVCENGNIRCVE